MKKINLKSIITIVILLLVGVLGVLGINTARTYMSGASAGSEPKSVVAKPGEDGKSAIISWTSDKPTMGIVEYGTTPASLLLRAIESSETTSHQVSISPLKPGVSYYFRIRVGEEIYDNSGIPFSFKTKEGEPETVKPTEAPKAQATVAPVGSTCQTGVDYNNDGKVNSLDMVVCRQKNGETGTVAPTSTTAAPTTSVTSECSGTVDYNNDGKINSLDRVKCLQDKQ